MNDFENNTNGINNQNGADNSEQVESNTTYHYAYNKSNAQSEQPPTVDAQRVNTSPQQENAYQPFSQVNYQPINNAAPAKKKSKVAIIISVILAVCIIFSVIGIFVAKNETGGSTDNDDNTPSNPTEQVQAEEQGAVPKTDNKGNYTVAGIAENCIDSCVGITVYTQANSLRGSGSQSGGEKVKIGEGSGIIMQESNGTTYIMTCAHVIAEGAAFEVTLNNGDKYDATMVGADAQTDIGVIAIKAKGLKVARFANSDSTVLGEQVVAIGCPGGLNFMNSVTSGYVSALARPVSSKIGYDTECIQIDAAINPGNSGGALFNMNGQVIGVNSSKIASTDYEGMGFAVPSNTALATANSLIKVGYVEGRAKIGVTYKNIAGYSNSKAILAALDKLGFKDAQGTMVLNTINEDSDLYGKDVKEYDMIVAVNGQTLTSTDVMTSILSESKPGDTIKLTIARITGDDINTFEVECKLIEAKG